MGSPSLFRTVMIATVALLPACVVQPASAQQSQDVHMNFELPLFVECSAEQHKTMVAVVTSPGVYICEEPFIFHVTSNSPIGEFDLDYELDRGNLTYKGKQIRTWYIFRPAGGARPAADDPSWKTGQATQESAPLMWVLGSCDFELWCKVEVTDMIPGFYVNRWQVSLNMLTTTCTHEAMFICYVAREGEIPDEYELWREDDASKAGQVER